jgi:glycosyltransferase involved in cell wall biosynthesis
MKVLFICDSPPSPRGTSDAVIAYNRIRLLAQRGHPIGLLSFLPAEQGSVPSELQKMVLELEMVPAPPRRPPLLACLRSRGIPWLAAPYQAAHSRDMAKLAGRMVARSGYDVVVAGATVMGQYLYRNVYLPAVHRVISCQGTVAAARRRAAGFRRWWDASGQWGEEVTRRIEAFETGMFRYADCVITITLEEREELMRASPDLNVGVVPYGLNASDYAWQDPRLAEPEIVFAGAFLDEADCDGAVWFLRNVWPAVARRHPQVRFCIAGRRVPRRVRRLVQRSRGSVEVREDDGTSADAFTGACVLVCPIRVHAGFQSQVLRAMACGVPVVSTTAGAEGLPAQTGHNLFLADTAHVMAENIDLLLEDAELRRTLALRARKLVTQHFPWQQSVDKLEAVLRQVVG